MTVLNDPLIGRVIRDTWKVEEFVARGSMGAVYRAVNLEIGTPVAVKVLNPEFLHDEEIRERFRREATVSSRCDSAHLVKVLDLSTEPDGYVALIMEWLHGESLAAFLKRRGHLTVPEVATMLTQVGEGLAEAHAAGIIHRDLKPGNIYLAESGHGPLVVPKILDFGISKIVEEGGDLTGTATMMGTPHYMPVEQFDSSRDVDQRADIYALGVICYELLAGRRPFAGSSPVQILNKITSQDPPPLPDSVDPGVAAVVLRAMARHAEDRYSRVEDLVEAFTEAAEAAGLGPEAPPTTVGVYEVDGQVRVKRPHEPFWRRYLLPLSGGAVVALLLAVGLPLALCSGGNTPLTVAKRAQPRATPKPWTRLRTLLPADAAAQGLATDGGARLLAGVSKQGAVRVWQTDSGKLLGTWGQRARSVALAPDGRWMATGSRRGAVRLRQLAERTQRTLGSHAAAVQGLSFSGDANRLASGDASGQLRVWDTVSGRVVAQLSHGSPVQAVALSGDGSVAVSGHADGQVVVWDVTGQGEMARLTAHVGGVYGLALHAAGRLAVSGGADGAVRVWRLPGKKPTRTLTGHRGAVRAVALTEDGRQLLTGGADHTVRLWDLPTGAERGRMTLQGPVTRGVLARGGKLRVVTGPTLGVQLFAPPPN